MAVGNVKGFKVKEGNETGIAKIATEAYLDGSVTKAKLATAVQDTLDEVPNKADANGDYDDLTAGSAKELLSTVYVEDQAPYNFRTSGGTADIGDRMYDEVVGGTVVWNQSCFYPNTPRTVNGVTFTVSNGYVTANGTATGGTAAINADTAPTGKANHVIYVTGCPSGGAWNKYAFREGYTEGYEVSYDYGNGKIFKKGSTDRATGQIIVAEGTTVENLVFKPQIFDLTQMFGSTIADYIYSLEQGTAGAGVAWFRNLFPKPYYAYNAGELMSVKAGSHDTVGFNAWDEEWELGLYQGSGKSSSNNYMRCKNLIPVIEGQTYRIERPCRDAYTWGYADKNYSNGVSISEKSNGNIEIPRGVHYLGFSVSVSQYGSSTYKNDMCVHLVWDGERNGEYEPYDKHTYPLDADLVLRGIPKLDANNNLYYDGDTYASDGTVTRRYGVVDLGTLNDWAKGTTSTSGNYFTVPISDIKTIDSASTVANIFCPPWKTNNQQTWQSNKPCVFKLSSASNNRIGFSDSAYDDMTKEEFKAAMSGVYLVYELATPTTEEADPYQNPQLVDDFGTEEYVDYAYEAGDRDVAIPVGHNSQYMNNLRAKLEMAPDSPDGDGDYIVRQSNGENSYVPYTGDGRLTALEAKVPAPPSTNGTYKLTATVTDGEVTYTWTAG